MLPLSATSLLPSLIGPLARELRFFDPSTGTQLLTYAESERSRIQAKQAVGDAVEQAEQVAEEERQRAEG